MAQRCPVCGTRFPDYANVCDQHGVALVPVRVRWMIVAAAAVGALVLLGAGPPAARAHYLSQINADVARLELRNPPGAAPSKPADLSQWLAGKLLHVTLRARNDGPLALPVADAKFRVVVSGVEVASGVVPAVCTLPAHASSEWEFDVPLTNAPVRNALMHPPAEGLQLEVYVDGHVRLLGIAWPAHISRRMRLKPVLEL